MRNFLSEIWNNRLYLVLTSAVLLSLSFPPFPAPFLQIPAFILLFRLIDRCNTAREAAYSSYPLFVCWNLAVTYWLMLATLAGGVAAILANSVLMTLPVMLIQILKSRMPGTFLKAITFAATWTLYEYLHHHWDLAWPWLSLANGWSTLPPLIQYISITGMWGVTFWVVLTSFLFYVWVKQPGSPAKRIAWAALFMPLFVSVLLLWMYDEKPDAYSRVVVTQPNYDSYQRLGGFETSREALKHIIELTDSLVTPQTDAVFWPENAVRPALYEHGNDPLTPLLEQQSKQWNTTIITGTTYYDFFTNEQSPALVRERNGQKYIYYNAALSFSPQAETERYYKGKLVPIVERIPFLPFLNQFNLFNINWGEVGWLGRGYNQNNFQSGNSRFPALVCYDSVFPGWVRGFVRREANMLAIITNDGWWGRTSGHIQHFEYARLRAIENRRWIVRSANNGISGIITATGSIMKKIAYKKTDVFAYRVPLLKHETIYLKWGDWFPRLCLVWVSISIGWVFVKRYRYK